MQLSTALKRVPETVKILTIQDLEGVSPLDVLFARFTQIEELHVLHDVAHIPPEIALLQGLKRLRLMTPSLKVLPAAFDQLAALETLHLEGLPLQALPPQLAQLGQLRQVTLVDCAQLMRLPAVLGQLPALAQLELRQCPIGDWSALAEGFAALQTLHLSAVPLQRSTVVLVSQHRQLTELTLAHSQLSELPDALLQLQGLELLHLPHHQLTALPAGLTQLPRLRSLRFDHNQLTELPELPAAAQHWEGLGWANNPYQNLPLAVFGLPELVSGCYLEGSERKRHRQWVKAIHRHGLKDRALELFLQLKLGQPLVPNHYERADFLAVLQFPQKDFLAQALEALLDYEQARFQQQPLRAGHVVSVAGNVIFPRKSVRYWLRKIEVGYQNTITAATTHVLVGEGAPWEALQDPSMVLISIRDFQECLHDIKKPYLLEDDQSESVAHISELLLSTEFDQQELGLTLLEGGGVPLALLTELFAIARFSRKRSLIQTAKTLLLPQASYALRSKLKKQHHRNAYYHYHNAEKIEQLCAGTVLIPWKIALYIHRLNRQKWSDITTLILRDAPLSVAQNFLLETMHQHDPKEGFDVDAPMIPHLPFIYQHGNSLKILRFYRTDQDLTGIAALDQLEAVSFHFMKNIPLPADIAQLPRLQHVDFFNTQPQQNDWSNILQTLQHCKALRTLSLLSSPAPLPIELAQLTGLEELSLKDVTLTDADFQILKQLVHLKKLAVDQTSEHLDKRYCCFPNLTHLLFQKQGDFEVTPHLSTLSQLQTLEFYGGVQLLDDLKLPQLQHFITHYFRGYYAPIEVRHLHSLTGLKQLALPNNFIEGSLNFLQMFQQLEALSINKGSHSIAEWIDLLATLPHLKTWSYPLSYEEYQDVSRALPHLELL